MIYNKAFSCTSYVKGAGMLKQKNILNQNVFAVHEKKYC